MNETLFVKLQTPCVELSRDIADHSPEIFRDSSTVLGMTKGDCRVAGFFGAPSSKRLDSDLCLTSSRRLAQAPLQFRREV